MRSKEEAPFNLPVDKSKQKINADELITEDNSNASQLTPISSIAWLEQTFLDFPSWIRRFLLYTITIVFFIALINYSSAHLRQAMCQWGWGLDKHCEHRPQGWNRALFP